MAFETLKASIYALLDEIAGQPEDPHVLHERLETTLAEMRGLGQPLPEDLVELDEWLGRTLAARRHGGPVPQPPRHLLERGRKSGGRAAERHPPPHSEKGD